jgi:hydrogenase/urease accessory protein HupE
VQVAYGFLLQQMNTGETLQEPLMRIATVLFILFLSPVTHAHPEYVGWTGGDFASGMAHVLSGLDHWATWLVLGSLLAVSSWRWRIPVSVMALIYLGAHTQIASGAIFVAGCVLSSLLLAGSSYAAVRALLRRPGRASP